MRRLFWTALIATLLTPATARAQDEVVYYHTDAIGSVRAMTDETGAVIHRYDFLPFGEAWDPPPNSDTRQFAGKERDRETGLELDYFGARYHLPVIGRFTTVDPALDVEAAMTDPQLWNRYAYVTNSPFRYRDPDGRQREFLDQDIRDLLAKKITVDEYNARIQARGAGALVGVGVVAAGVVGVEAMVAVAGSVQTQILVARLATLATGGGAIDRAIRSANAAVRFEGETAKFLAERNLLRAFNSTIAGRQIDAIAGGAKQFVIEMTTGQGGGKLAQAAAQAKATGLDVIIYGQNLTQGFVREATRQGYRVARSLDELEKLLR